MLIAGSKEPCSTPTKARGRYAVSLTVALRPLQAIFVVDLPGLQTRWLQAILAVPAIAYLRHLASSKKPPLLVCELAREEDIVVTGHVADLREHTARGSVLLPRCVREAMCASGFSR